MSEDASTPPRKTSRLFTIWALGLIALGGIGGGYLAALWAKPELVSRTMPMLRQDATDTAAASALTQDVTSLRGSIDQIQMDVAKLKVEVSEHGERNRHVADRLNVLESRPAPQADTSRTESSVPAGTVPFSLISGPEKVEPETTPQASLPAAPAADRAASQAIGPEAPAKPQGKLETGSVGRAAPPPVAFGAPVIKPAQPKPSGIQLGAGASVDEIRLSWLALSDRHGDALRNLQPRYIVGRNGSTTTYNLLAGPMKTPADAKRVCAALEGAGVPCSVGNFNGNAL